MIPNQERREAFAFIRGLLYGLALAGPFWLCVLLLVL